MKVRWTRGSIRFRITPSELTALGRGECVREMLELPGGVRWGAHLRPGSLETQISADGMDVICDLSMRDVRLLEEPDREGLYFQAESPAPLRYLVEKDFPCIHPRGSHLTEPETESFPAPLDFAARKGVAS